MRKTLIALFVIFLLTSITIISVSAETIETGTEENIQLASYDGNIKPLEELLDIAALREYLTTEMAKCTPKITVSQFGIPKTAVYVSALSELIFDEMPEIFHVSTYGYSYSQSTGKIVSVSPTYDCNAAEYAERMEACKTAAENILEDIKDNEKISDVQKALLIHDRLALWCAYDLENLENDTLQPEAYTMYGALGMGRAVCEGYANAYMYLLDQVGIDSYICSSMSLNHAWNIVEIDGMWYHVDVTWDDPVWDISGRVNHQNFLRSSEDFFEETGHTARDYDTTPRDETYDDAFWQDSQAAFQLVNGEIYYIDHTTKTLKHYDGEIICSVESRWSAGGSGYWIGNFSRLAEYKDRLYYSLSDSVYLVDPVTGNAKVVFTPDTKIYGNAFRIYGLICRQGVLYCELRETPNSDSHVKPVAYVVRDIDAIENYGKPTSAANNVGCDINKDGCVNLIDIAVLLFVRSGN